MLLILLVGVFLFALYALNAGEHKLARPGIARPLTITLIILLAWFAWPLYAPLVTWIIPR